MRSTDRTRREVALDTIQKLNRELQFAAKHAVATAVVTTGIVGFTAASYFALLAWAVLIGGGLGGPLAFPFMVVFALIASVVAAGLILLPTTALTEWICVRRGYRTVLQIPVATGCLAAYLLSVAGVTALVRRTPFSEAAWAASILFVLLLVPLGAYWWSLQSADWMMRMGARLWTHINRGRAEPPRDT